MAATEQRAEKLKIKFGNQNQGVQLRPTSSSKTTLIVKRPSSFAASNLL